MTLRELLPIIDPEEVVVVHTELNRGFRSVVSQVHKNERYAKYLDRQVTFLAHFDGRESGYDIYLKGE